MHKRLEYEEGGLFEDDLGLMKVSLGRNIFTRINVARVAHGVHYTEDDCWLTPAVNDFLVRVCAAYGLTSVLDPFAGDGHMLRAIHKRFPLLRLGGMDLVADKWPKNDSLERIRAPDHSFICTNPPYLAKYSARRKGVDRLVSKYFEGSPYDDLYLVALGRMLETGRPTVAIVPETFISSGHFREDLRVITILEKYKPFGTTETPVCVACFDPCGAPSPVEIFRDDAYLGRLSDLTDLSMLSVTPATMKFNAVNGVLALKAVDGTQPSDRIRFMPASDFAYCDSMIKGSSRLMTKIELAQNFDEGAVAALAKRCNDLLEEIRFRSRDVVLSPFKGNNKAGTRRRRLDYRLARLIISYALRSKPAGEA